MIREVANQVLHSRVPEGFQWIEEYGQYYSPSCRFFYDPNSGLFYHSDSETYYVFNDDTQQYEVYKCMQKTQWTSRTNKKKAKQMFAEVLDKFDQDAVDVCEVVFDLVAELSLDDHNASITAPKHRHDDQHERESSSVEYFDEDTGETIRVAQSNAPNKQHQNGKRRTRDGRVSREWRRQNHIPPEVGESSGSDSSEEDERIQMREEERFSQPPMLRIIDSKNNLHVITICGGVVGRQTGCDIIIEDPTISRKLLEFVFVPESNSFVVNMLAAKGHVVLNDYELLPNDEREIEHGDLLKFGNEFLVIHVHFGNNTCPGCEPGLLVASTNPVPQPLAVPRGETARRRNLKAIKAMYGINEYAENAKTHFPGVDRAAKRRRLVGSGNGVGKEKNEVPDPNDIYAECAAKPLPGASVVPKADPSKPLNDANKGFRLLQSMGWKEGEGLGKAGQGRSEPVESALRSERLGLGAQDPKAAPPKTWKAVVLDKTRERYEKVRFF
ncbi:hypothetical protein Q1695_006354 [Nippostrongylus brasiliensis]|nr:hypothetical protein Q1695_006354 [Nippostrongylus brasiliensis]